MPRGYFSPTVRKLQLNFLIFIVFYAEHEAWRGGIRCCVQGGVARDRRGREDHPGTNRFKKTFLLQPKLPKSTKNEFALLQFHTILTLKNNFALKQIHNIVQE